MVQLLMAGNLMRPEQRRKFLMAVFKTELLFLNVYCRHILYAYSGAFVYT